MQRRVAGYRYLMAVFLGSCLSTLPVLGDALSEALPMPESQSITQESKPEPKKKVQIPTPKEVNVKKQSAPSAPTPETPEEEYVEEGPNDPLENINRVMFGINEVLDFLIIRPVAEIYRAITPEPVRNGVSNALDNLYAPVSFLNNVLQAEAERAAVTLFRFLVNSTFGMGGLVNVASELGYPRYDTDFNQTLTAWGVDTGPYLVLPIIGPSSFRGGVGLVADYYSDPLNLYLMNPHHHKYRYWLTVRYGLDIVRNREKVIETIDNLRNGSLDMYVTMRSIYFQRQAYMAEKLKSANSPVGAKEEGKSSTS
jgi:phospholipid-binding lipoprotein MlaA